MVFRRLRSNKITKGMGPAGTILLLKYGVASLMDALTSLSNNFLCTNSIPNYWRPVTIVPTPTPRNSSTSGKRFRPIVVNPRDLELMEMSNDLFWCAR